MWVRLGRYERENAMELISWLRKAKIRCDIKPCIGWRLRERYYVQGKLSELKKLKFEEVDEWERYVRIARELVKKPIGVEEFEDKFLSKVNPERHTFVKRCIELIGDKADFSKLEEAGISISRFVDTFWEEYNFMLEVFDMLEMNGVEVTDVVKGELPEDPRLVVELKEYKRGAKTLYELELFKAWEVYVDAVSVAGRVDFEEEFKVNYWDEFILLASIASLIDNYVSFLSENPKIDIDALRDFEKGFIEGDAVDIAIDAEGLTEEVVKSLEEAGFVRRKGKTIIWRGSR